jgi:hypothetical protein
VHTVNYASERSEIWRWYWRAWLRPAGLWRFHVMYGLMFAFIFTVLLEPGAFRPGRFLGAAVIATIACVALLPLWPQIRFKPAMRSLTINAEGLTTSVGNISGSRLWKDVRTIEQIDGTIAITGNNKNAFIVPARAFANDREREDFYESARQWHSQAIA